MQNLLPIITIGGFLGAGKTTLINHLLHQTASRRLVVFVNDFGEINIDQALIETAEEDRISLTNGCVCCTLNNDLVEKIAEYAKTDSPPDGVVVEASGVADPRAFDSSFGALESAGLARLDARVYVLDALGFSAQPFELAEQIIDHAAASDLILLNKEDLAVPCEISNLVDTLKVSAPYSNIVHTKYCAIDSEIIFDLKPAISNKAINKRSVEGRADTHGFLKWHYETQLLINRKQFEKFVQTLPNLCFRAKGLLRFADAPRRTYLFNQVGVQASLENCRETLESGQTQFVAIGHKDTFLKEQIEQGFRETLV